MNRTLLAAAAALIVVVAGAAIVLRPAANIGPPGSPTPIPTSQPTTGVPNGSGGLVPAELMHTWVGVPHDFPGHSNVQSLNMGFEFGQLSASVNFVYGQNAFISRASVVGANTLELTAVANGCDLGVVGHYTWSLSPGGTLLHLAAVDDPCAARSGALVGDWHAANCKDATDQCWGDLEAGTYPTTFFIPRLSPSEQPAPAYGAMTFTVPDGWAEAGDHGTDIRLTRSSDYATEGSNGPVGQPTGIEAWVRPTANYSDRGCDVANANMNHTVGVLANWVHGLPGLESSPVHDITIDGHTGQWLDISVSRSWTQACSGVRTAPFITEEVGSAGPIGDKPYLVGISGQTRMRVIFLDVGARGNFLRNTVMILVTAPDQATFDSFVQQAMPIVQSFHFN